MNRILYTLLSLFVINVSCLFAQGPVLSWAKRIGGTNHDYSNFICYDYAGNVYTIGNFSGTVDFDPGSGIHNLSASGGVWPDVFISKLDASGNFIWAKNIGGNSADDGYSLAIDDDGNVYSTGHFQDTADFDPGPAMYNMASGNGSSDVFILKLDSLGDFVWAKKIGANSDDVGFSITLDNSDNVFVTGYYEESVDFDPDSGVSNMVSGIFADAFILKLNSSGNYLWSKSVGGLALDNGRSIALDEGGNIYTMGVYQNTADFDPDSSTSYSLTAAGVYDIYVSKLSPSGNFIWAKSIGGKEYDHGHAMTLDASGNVYLTGTFQDTSDYDPDTAVFNLIATSNSQDIFICKLDSAGNFRWASSMGSTSSDQGTGIAVDLSGNVYYTGFFNGTVDFDAGAGTANMTSVNDDVFISKMDSVGNFLWAESISGNFAQLGESISVDRFGNIYTTGEFADTADFDPTSGVYNLSSDGTHFDVYVEKLAQTATGINKISTFNSIQAFPNPSSGKMNFRCSEKIIDGELRIYDSYGQLITQSENINEKSISLNLEQSANGVYFVFVTTGNKIFRTKFVIQH